MQILHSVQDDKPLSKRSGRITPIRKFQPEMQILRLRLRMTTREGFEAGGSPPMEKFRTATADPSPSAQDGSVGGMRESPPIRTLQKTIPNHLGADSVSGMCERCSTWSG